LAWKIGFSAIYKLHTSGFFDLSWFKLLGDRKFESEKEVEFYFVMPILEQLGYTEDWDSRTMYAALPKGEK
jgi:hypothetical protein